MGDADGPAGFTVPVALVDVLLVAVGFVVVVSVSSAAVSSALAVSRIGALVGCESVSWAVVESVTVFASADGNALAATGATCCAIRPGRPKRR